MVSWTPLWKRSREVTNWERKTRELSGTREPEPPWRFCSLCPNWWRQGGEQWRQVQSDPCHDPLPGKASVELWGWQNVILGWFFCWKQTDAVISKVRFSSLMWSGASPLLVHCSLSSLHHFRTVVNDLLPVSDRFSHASVSPSTLQHLICFCSSAPGVGLRLFLKWWPRRLLRTVPV